MPMERGFVYRLGAAVGLLSAGITAFQLVLMQLLSYVQWYHFAYLLVSMALLGFGASGTFLALFRQYLVDRSPHLIFWLLLGCGTAMPIVVALSQTDLLRFDLYLLFVERAEFWKLAACCFLYLLPFFLGALVIGLVLIGRVEKVGTLYFANLVGSGAVGLIPLTVKIWYKRVDLKGRSEASCRDEKRQTKTKDDDRA